MSFSLSTHSQGFKCKYNTFKQLYKMKSYIQYVSWIFKAYDDDDDDIVTQWLGIEALYSEEIFRMTAPTITTII